MHSRAEQQYRVKQGLVEQVSLKNIVTFNIFEYVILQRLSVLFKNKKKRDKRSPVKFKNVSKSVNISPSHL